MHSVPGLSPLNSLINAIRFPPSPSSAEPCLSSSLASVVLWYSEQAICRDTTVAFCLGLGQSPLPSCRAEWASVLHCTQLNTQTHILLAWKNRHQTHSICNLFLHRETLEWLKGLSCITLCVCVFAPTGLSMIH